MGQDQKGSLIQPFQCGLGHLLCAEDAICAFGTCGNVFQERGINALRTKNGNTDTLVAVAERQVLGKADGRVLRCAIDGAVDLVEDARCGSGLEERPAPRSRFPRRRTTT